MVKNKFNFNSKTDYQNAVEKLCQPLTKFFSPQRARLIIGNSGTYCSENISYMEAFARPLWGLVPLLAGGGKTEMEEIYLQGIKAGTNPDSLEYWGTIEDKDQRMVEMAVIGLALCLAPHHFWQPLNKIEQENLYQWLWQINTKEVVDSNWLFFRVLVNLGIKNVDWPYDKIKLNSDLKRLDEFYLADGWYSDGISEQRDYYVAFAMHFYSLIYAKIMESDDPQRSLIFKTRAGLFAKQFIFWFAKDGSAIPFGRSLIYRFAQSAFWGALAFADVEVYSWGVIKGILARNLRWWFSRDIFTTDNILNIGYAYQNLNIAEGYNAPGSPYWALKAFLPIALPDNHPFWTAHEEDFPNLPEQICQIHPHMIIQHQEKSNHVVALTSGQYADFEPVHFAAKYEKFAYSNLFGFSVPRSDYKLNNGAYDSMLALSEDGDFYRIRQKCLKYKIEKDCIYSLWRPWPDVEINTWLIPHNHWHLRIHIIKSSRKLLTSEGGFAILRNDDMKNFKNAIIKEEVKILIDYPWGLSGIMDLGKNRQPNYICPEPNTNIIAPRTILPTLEGQINPGTTKLICAVFGSENSEDIKIFWKREPKLNEIPIENIQIQNYIHD